MIIVINLYLRAFWGGVQYHDLCPYLYSDLNPKWAWPKPEDCKMSPTTLTLWGGWGGTQVEVLIPVSIFLASFLKVK